MRMILCSAPAGNGILVQGYPDPKTANHEKDEAA